MSIDYGVFDGLNNNYSKENLDSIFNGIVKYNNKKLYAIIFISIKSVLINHNNPNLGKFKPKNGYEFVDKNNFYEPMGIYHSHLLKYKSELLVLVWYFRENNKNYYDIIFEVLPHPNDDYEQILKNIKSDKMVINPNTWKNYENKKYLKTFFEFCFYKK